MGARVVINGTRYKSNNSWKSWNSRYAGKPAFTAESGRGYLRGSIFGRWYLAHRIAFLWMTGRWPAPETHHRNHVGTDNRWNNLVEETREGNNRDTTLPVTNKSGRIGVHFDRCSGKYRAMIGKGRTHLGYFSSLADACAARAAAELQYGYGPGHGAPKPGANDNDNAPAKPEEAAA